jgi:signal transduction histidine kinase
LHGHYAIRQRKNRRCGKTRRFIEAASICDPSYVAVLRLPSLHALSLHTRLLVVVAVALLPVVALAIAGLVALGREQHAHARQGLVERSRAIASAVDLELFNSVEALKILALSERLSAGDLRRFHAEVRTSVVARTDWDAIILVDPAGKRLLNTRVPYGEPLPGGIEVIEKESFDAVVATRKPSIGVIALGPAGKPRFPVRVPVERGGELRYVLTAVVKPDLMREILVRQKLPPESVSSVFDSRLTIVARSRNHERYVGNKISESLVLVMGDAEEGWGRTTTLERQPVYSAFARSARSSWGIALGVPQEAVDAPLWRFYALSGAGFLLSLALGVLASAWLGRRVAGQLQKAHAELEASNQELDAFSYSVSHDLRAPLRAVDGFSRILLEDYTAALPEDARNLLRDVRANALQMGRLVDDLLAFSRLSRQPVKAVTVDTADLVRQCLTELEPDHRGRRMTVRVAELPSCLGDPVLLKQVWMNLLANAIKYTAKRSEALIEVGAIHEPGRVGYYVKDNGVGFDMTYAHKLFGVFQRLHKAEDYPGTGVGLAVVQRIVHRHGGEVRADARPDAGATFVFTLPSEGTPT